MAVTGSTGLIGTALVEDLRARGHRVVRLVRQAPAGEDEIAWDPLAPAGGLGPGALDGVDAVVHLAGANVAGRRWTAAYKEEIRASRVRGTRALVSALTAASNPPSVLLSGSAIGWYGDTGGREVDESSPAGSGYLPGLVAHWEAAARQAAEAGVRVVTMRAGVVMSRRGGMLARLLLPFRLGLGARLGSGTQVMSWITLADYAAIVSFLLSHAEISGPVNLTTPHPVTNAEFTSALAAALHRPGLLFVPEPALRLALGGVSSDILSSARVMPRRLQAAGYRFRFPDLREALGAELAAVQGERAGIS
ncbi:MAG TPA: TIGR01777 family oxidoreductase [Streptosporangiaceae bacterium]|nr:TIGR01777 family oxidoreductase [Streptosporangiaceae bacterium]